MLSFLFAASLMLIVALAFVLAPLLRARRSGLSDAEGNIAVLRAQKGEIERDFTQGTLSGAEHDAALAELSARALEEVPAEAPGPAPSGRPPRRLAALLAAAIAIAAVSWYAAMGNRAALLGPEGPAGAQAAAPAAEGPDEKQVLAMVDALARKMEQNPSDPKGWVLLGRSQAALGRFAEAVRAFEHAVALSPKDAQLLADYADAMAMIQQGRFDGKPMALIARALALDAKNLKALALAGTGELRMGNRAASLVHWKRLQALLPRASDDFRQVEAIIREVNDRGAADAAKAAAGPDRAENAAAGRIEGQVALAPELAGQIAAGDTLFVFARAAAGPRMPLAVMKIPAPKTWPQPYLLTDAMAMTPAMKLSAFSEVIVEARISRSGNASPQPGDLSGSSATVTPGAGAVAVTINRRQP